MSLNSCLRLSSRPKGRIAETDLELVKESMPVPQDGQMVVKNLYASIDPTHRVWMSDRPQYMECVALGDVMRASTIGIVTESKCADYPVGTYVFGFGGLSEYYLGIPGITVSYPVEKSEATPLALYASALSPIIGLTAWVGVNTILKVGAEDIVVVSGASGAVGSIVGQLSKKKGASVIGIAGGEAKCQNLKDLGFDVAIDYRSQNVDEQLKKAAPEGITCYFDNVGGDVSDAVLLNFRNYGRYAVCGSISEYEDNWSGLRNFNMILMRRLTVQGFVVSDHWNDFEKAREELVGLIAAGELKYKEDVRTGGLPNYVKTVNDLFDGKNIGKLILQIAEDA